MFLLLTDETNNTPSEKAKFFIYGGLVVPLERLFDLSERIQTIRSNSGYSPEDTLKFDTRARPEHVSREQCTLAKQQILEACIENECIFIANIVLHEIAKNRDPRELITWAADHVINNFNKYLREQDSHGIVLIDSLPVDKQFQYLSERFTSGITKQDQTSPLDRIQLYGATVINASHVSSAMDIVLGSLRYAVNDPANPDAAKSMMENVCKLMWYREHEGEKYLGERGLIFRPVIENIRVEDYRDEYSKLQAYLQELIKDVE